MTDQPSRVAGRQSAQVPDHQEHEDTGEQHASDHDELVLGGSPLDQPHHRVGQPQHVGHVQHLLVCPLQRSRDTEHSSVSSPRGGDSHADKLGKLRQCVTALQLPPSII